MKYNITTRSIPECTMLSSPARKNIAQSPLLPTRRLIGPVYNAQYIVNNGSPSHWPARSAIYLIPPGGNAFTKRIVGGDMHVLGMGTGCQIKSTRVKSSPLRCTRRKKRSTLPDDDKTQQAFNISRCRLQGLVPVPRQRP